MDGATVGLIGGIVGGVVGVCGGLIGTYVSIKNTNGPKERAAMVRWAIYCWLGVSVFLLLMFILPSPYRFFLFIPYVPLLFLFIKKGNEAQAKIRLEESAGGEPE